MPTISSVSPLLLSTITTSFAFTIPRPPCKASEGCRYREAVPVLVRVAAIFCAMIPDLPTPTITTLPAHAISNSMTRSTWAESRREAATAMAFASSCNRLVTSERLDSSVMRAALIYDEGQLLQAAAPSFSVPRAAVLSFAAPPHARVAQWIRAFASGAKGRRFDPCRGYHFFWFDLRFHTKPALTLTRSVVALSES